MIHYYASINLRKLKLFINRRLWLRRILLPPVRMIRQLNLGDASKSINLNLLSIVRRLSFRYVPQIIILQPGKVGSLTIKNSLENAYRQLMIPPSVHHAHALNDLDQRENYIKSTRKNPAPSIRQIQHWRKLREKIDKYPKKEWKIINLVRDPVAIKVSALFQLLNQLNPDWQSSLNVGKLNMSHLDDIFYSLQELSCKNLDYWYENQIKALWGIDIFSTPFPKEKGYKIYRKENISLLIIRLEDLNHVADQAFYEFLGLKKISILDVNIGNKKPYAKLYAEFKERPIREQYIKEAYQSRYAKHFYTNDEIDAFRKHWLKK